MSDELFGKIICNVVLRGTLVLLAVAVEIYVVQRGDAIIRHGRRVQDALAVPRWARVFSEMDPGMPEQHLRIGAEAAILLSFLSMSGGLTTTMVAKDPGAAATLAVAVMSSIQLAGLLVIWLVLVLKRRKRERYFVVEKEAPRAYLAYDWKLGFCERSLLARMAGQPTV